MTIFLLFQKMLIERTQFFPNKNDLLFDKTVSKPLLIVRFISLLTRDIHSLPKEGYDDLV
jgi:hypothetical protein